MRGVLRTEVWVHETIRHELFERAFRRKFPRGKIKSVVDNADPKRHPKLRFVEVETFSDEERKFWEFFDRFAALHGFGTERGIRTSFPRPGPHPD